MDIGDSYETPAAAVRPTSTCALRGSGAAVRRHAIRREGAHEHGGASAGGEGRLSRMEMRLSKIEGCAAGGEERLSSGGEARLSGRGGGASAGREGRECGREGRGGAP